MHFPQLDQVALRCQFEQIVPGQLHRDGRRYLPLLVLRPLGLLANSPLQVTPPDMQLGVVDRHHLVDQALLGRVGVARLICALSTLEMQQPPYRQGLLPEPAAHNRMPSTTPQVLGRVQAVLAWETQREHLPYESLYTELLLDIGGAVLGVRTNLTAEKLSAVLGKDCLEPGDWIALNRSRVDILGFVVN